MSLSLSCSDSLLLSLSPPLSLSATLSLFLFNEQYDATSKLVDKRALQMYKFSYLYDAHLSIFLYDLRLSLSSFLEQSGVEAYDALSFHVIYRKRAL